MEDQHHLGVGNVIALPTHVMEDNPNRHLPQRVSRFSIQRLDTTDINSMMPRRRASVNHGQANVSRSEFVASSYITMDDIGVAQPIHPIVSGHGRPSVREHGRPSVRDHAKGSLIFSQFFFSFVVSS